MLESERRRAHEPREGWDAEDRHRENDVRHAAAQDRDDADREQDAGEREEHVANAHDDPVPPAFEVAGRQTEDRTRDGADRDRDESRGQRYPRTHQDAAEDVATERVDAEPMLPRRPRVELVVVEITFGVVWNDPGRESRDENEQNDKHTRYQRDLLLLELAPELGSGRTDRVAHRYRIAGLMSP